ncbi:hypothetical protein [Vibrio phage LP.1]|nr:hypothetical protein [Vibrio phage LP.1]
MKKLLLTAAIAVTVTGCANRPIETVSDHPVNADLVEKVFIGVPVMLSAEGSTVRLNEEWVLTVAHNWPILVGRDVYYHPECDFALVRDSGEGKATTDYAYFGETVYMTGYPLAMPFTVTKGDVIHDFVYEADKCLYTAIDSTMIKGMSGGGVFDSDGNLVGVNVGWADGLITWPDGRSYHNPALMMTIAAMEEWIEEITGYDVLD